MGSSYYGQTAGALGQDKFPIGNELYKSLKQYLLPQAQLFNNGLPRPHSSGDAGRADAKIVYSYVHDQARRTCDRCKEVYAVRADGTPAIANACRHHAGKLNSTRVGGGWKMLYACCRKGDNSPGCKTANSHVPKSPPVSWVHGFVSCVQEAGDENVMGKNDWDIVAMDCEMVTTIEGRELARATFLGIDGNILYDKLVLPSNPILDYNTAFSGLTAAVMRNASATLKDVQDAMLAGLKPNSIIIGHSLESDFPALKLKHDCVIDTSVIYPHPKGLPYKYSLRSLINSYLGQTIQSQSGHDSAEDARAALNLVYHKLK